MSEKIVLGEEEKRKRAEQEKQDTLKEAEMLKGGGKYEVDEKGDVIAFVFSPEQRPVLYNEENIERILEESPSGIFIPVIRENNGRETAVDKLRVNYHIANGAIHLFEIGGNNRRTVQISDIKEIVNIFNAI